VLARVRYIVSSGTDRVKPKTIKLVFVTSPLSTQHSGERTETCWPCIRITRPTGATCVTCGLVFQLPCTIQIK